MLEFGREDAPGVGLDFEVAAGGVLAEGGEGERDLLLSGFEEAELLQIDGHVEMDPPLAGEVICFRGEAATWQDPETTSISFSTNDDLLATYFNWHVPTTP